MWLLRTSLLLFVCVCACSCEEKDPETRLERVRNNRIRHSHQDPTSRSPAELTRETDSRLAHSWDILSASSTNQEVDKITNNATRNDSTPPSTKHSNHHRGRDGVKRRRNKRRRAKTTPETRQADATVATPVRTELDVDAVQRAKEQRRRDRKQKGNKQKERKNNRKNNGEARHQRRGKKKLKDTLIGQKVVNKTISRNALENEIEMKVYEGKKDVVVPTETTTVAMVAEVDNKTEVFVREEVDNDLRVETEGGIPRNYQDLLAERNRKLAGNGHNEADVSEENVIPTDSVPASTLPDTHVTDDNVVPLLPASGRGKSRRPCKGSRRGGCEQICTEVEGRPVCSCYKGFRSHGNKCKDINECSIDNGSCQEGCRNTLGSFHCTCPAGFRITDDDRSCRDVNECLLRNGHGPCQDRCTNTLGTYTCSCEGLPGTQLATDKHRCLDLDECLAGNGGCSHLCLNTLGNVFCLCPPGMVLGQDWKTCEDINECETDGEPNDICPEKCVNTVGSYHCTKHLDCGPGYTAGTSECEDVDECLNSDCSQTCINTNGSYHCSCETGYNLQENGKTCEKAIVCEEGFTLENSQCKDVDECEDSDCSQQCINTNGSYHCSCDYGFKLQDDMKSCEKIICPVGYKLGATHCEDINECYDSVCSQFCTNTNGSYYCSCDIDFNLQNDMKTCVRNIVCPEGFKLGFSHCEDIDECENSDCSQNCINTNGSYHCSCDYGYRLQDDQKTCLKIICPEGYKLGATDCEDINECHQNYCSQQCTNTNGSFFCSCDYGYRLQEDQKTCLKIICPEGYKLGATDCEDINECHQNYCSQHCTNTNGSYFCSCKHGFTLQSDRTTCKRKIVCPEGFKLGVSECEDIDECRDSDCHQLCINTNGSYHCACKLGYVLKDDRKTCSQGALTAVCPPLDIPAHGYLECYRLSLRSGPWRHRVVNHSGSVCKLRCPIGFKLDGVYRRFCGQTGKWLGLSYGSCVRLPVA